MERTTILWMLKAAQMSNLPTLIYKFHVILFKIPAGLFEGLDKFVLKYIEAIMSTIAEFILEERAQGGGRRRPTPPTWSGGFQRRQWICFVTPCNELNMGLGNERKIKYFTPHPSFMFLKASGTAWLADSLQGVRGWLSWIPSGEGDEYTSPSWLPTRGSSLQPDATCDPQLHLQGPDGVSLGHCISSEAWFLLSRRTHQS